MDSSIYGEHRLIHLDLKGCPIRIEYLEKLFPLFKEWGASGILIEWEDTFPYSESLSKIGSKNTYSLAYSEKDVEKIYTLAKSADLTVIPLVQTFGHLEFVLKHDEWRGLREISKYPSSLCPSNPESLNLILTMLDQVIKIAPDISFIHIGADEVWHMAFCEKCNTVPKSKLFLDHTMKVLNHLQQNYPNIQPIMWDDMLRPLPIDVLKDCGIGNFVQPMVWHYQPSETFSIPDELWIKYSEVFESIWCASAFKGANSSCQVLPIVRNYISNHQSWLATLEKHSNRFKRFQGIALTGWSRYDHFATLCELLPVAVPSLAVCLSVWMNRGYDNDIVKSVITSFGYSDESLFFTPYPRPQPIPPELKFPGWKAAVGVEWCENVRAKHKSIMESDQVMTWLNRWQVKNNFTNPMQVECISRAFTELNLEWDTLESYLRHWLPEVFYDPTIFEWLGTLLEPLRTDLNALTEDVNYQIKRHS